MESINEVARAAIAQVPPQCRLQEGDAAVLGRHRDLLLGLEADAIKGFYDTLYAHPPTADLLDPQERARREGTLSHWWRRTVNGPLDDQYFGWMAMVGLVHCARRVSNPMMLSMTQFLAGFVAERVAASGLPQQEAIALAEAFRRLTATVGAIITYGYDRAYDSAVVTALFDLAGMSEALFSRLRDQEVSSALDKARADLAAGA